MLRRCVGAALVLFVVGGFLAAETINGFVTKIEDGKITVRTGGGRGKAKTEAKTITVKITKDTKFVKAGRDGSEPTPVSMGKIKTALEVVDGFRAKIETKGEGDDQEATTVTIGGQRAGGKRPGKKGRPKTDE
jgi:hypothetical protein